jgi:hypothetical protein
MKPNNNNNWKSYVDWWPTYLILGVSLAYLIDQTGIIPKLTNKFWKKAAE